MKVHPGEKHDAAARPRTGASFQQALRAVPPPQGSARAIPALRCQLRPLTAGLPVARALPGSSEGLHTVRQGLHAQVERLGEVRAELSERAEQRQAQRATELIARELVRELSREASASAPLPAAAPERLAVEAGRAEQEERRVGAAGAREAATSEVSGVEQRAEAALALIERIELFVRSQRPAMALSVGGALAATVEVERTGPREVALRIQGRRGPPAQEELEQLRTALEARGLQLRSLSVC